MKMLQFEVVKAAVIIIKFKRDISVSWTKFF